MFEDIYNNVLIGGKLMGLRADIQKALDEGAKPAEIINQGLIRGHG